MQKKTPEEQKREQEEQRLKDEERRLKKELAERPNDKELERRLQRNQRELERLEREKQKQAEQRRQLQRLQRELEKAAEQLRNKMSPEALKQLRDQMQQMENEIKKLGGGQKAEEQIAQLKEMLRRMGKLQLGTALVRGAGQGQKGQGRGQDGAGQGQRGKGGKGQLALDDFNQRAGHKKSDAFLLGGDGKGGQQLLLPLPGEGQPQPEGKGGDQPEGKGGDGIGNQHDPDMLGDATRLNGRRVDTRVQGKEGAGPSRSETILGSAEKGFSSQSYRRVYGDYTSVVEETMSKERVPPGYRFYVKRYFQLIRPRE
jgi:hypothetical protein